MSARILLAAMVLWGPTGSVVCELHCAQREPSAQLAQAWAPTAAPTEARPCHGHRDPAPASPAQESGPPAASCCYLHAALDELAPKPSADQTPPTFVSWVALEIGAAPTVSSFVLSWRPPGFVGSPYLHQNPPLLS
jgi:hypothetical protein